MRHGFRLAVLCGALVLSTLPLAGCGTTATGGGVSIPPSVTNSLEQIGAFAVTDLQNADTMAKANNDVIGSKCFEALITFVQGQEAQVNSTGGMTVSGAFSAFEATRNGLNTASNSLSSTTLQPLELGCGPLIVDTQKDVATFLANIASLGSLKLLAKPTS